jgi:hypothetical protein
MTMLMLSTGEYSDYQVHGVFRPLRDFVIGDALAQFKAQFVPEPDAYSNEPDPQDFLGWLCASGYIENAGVAEIHLGCYGELLVGEEAMGESFSAGA